MKSIHELILYSSANLLYVKKKTKVQFEMSSLFSEVYDQKKVLARYVYRTTSTSQRVQTLKSLCPLLPSGDLTLARCPKDLIGIYVVYEWGVALCFSPAPSNL